MTSVVHPVSNKSWMDPLVGVPAAVGGETRGDSLMGGFYMSSGSVAESVAGEKHTWKWVAIFPT